MLTLRCLNWECCLLFASSSTTPMRRLRAALTALLLIFVRCFCAHARQLASTVGVVVVVVVSSTGSQADNRKKLDSIRLNSNRPEDSSRHQQRDSVRPNFLPARSSPRPRTIAAHYSAPTKRRPPTGRLRAAPNRRSKPTQRWSAPMASSSARCPVRGVELRLRRHNNDHRFSGRANNTDIQQDDDDDDDAK